MIIKNPLRFFIFLVIIGLLWAILGSCIDNVACVFFGADLDLVDDDTDFYKPIIGDIINMDCSVSMEST